MPWWAWLLVVGVLVAVLTRRWNPISRGSAASELGRRWPVLIHFWAVWRVLIAVGIAGVAILVATRPGPHQATGHAAAAKPSPAPSLAPSPVPSPTRPPVATASPVPVPVPGEGHFPAPLFLLILLALAVAVVVAVWLLRRRDDWLTEPYPDLPDDLDADGWPPGSGPAPHHDDTEDEHHEEDQDLDQVDQWVDEYDPHGDTDPGGVVGARPVRGVPYRGRRLPRRR